MHPDWTRLSCIAAEVSGRSFNSQEMSRAFGEMLRAVGLEIQRERFVLPDEMKRPHWTFRRMYAALGLDETACAAAIERLVVSHGQRHIWCAPDPAAARVLDELKQQGLILAVISNTEDGRLTESLDAAGLSDRFDLLIDSHLVGHRKPDAAIFKLTLDRLGIVMLMMTLSEDYLPPARTHRARNHLQRNTRSELDSRQSGPALDVANLRDCG